MLPHIPVARSFWDGELYCGRHGAEEEKYILSRLFLLRVRLGMPLMTDSRFGQTTLCVCETNINPPKTAELVVNLWANGRTYVSGFLCRGSELCRDQAFSALVFPKAVQSLKVISDISISEASLAASSAQQGQELLFPEGQECLSLRGLDPSSSPFTAATSGRPSAQAPAANGRCKILMPSMMKMFQKQPYVSLW